MNMQKHSLLGQYYLQKFRNAKTVDCSFLENAKKEFIICSEIEPRSSITYHYLSLIEAELMNVNEAEKLIKKALLLDSSEMRSWNLFALIKSAKQDYEGCLAICNGELSGMISSDIR